MELTEMVKHHKLVCDGDWNRMCCTRCKKHFTIGADMCDADGIARELRRIDKIKCSK